MGWTTGDICSSPPRRRAGSAVNAWHGRTRYTLHETADCREKTGFLDFLPVHVTVFREQGHAMPCQVPMYVGPASGGRFESGLAYRGINGGSLSRGWVGDRRNEMIDGGG